MKVSSLAAKIIQEILSNSNPPNHCVFDLTKLEFYRIQLILLERHHTWPDKQTIFWFIALISRVIVREKSLGTATGGDIINLKSIRFNSIQVDSIQFKSIELISNLKHPMPLTPRPTPYEKAMPTLSEKQAELAYLLSLRDASTAMLDGYQALHRTLSRLKTDASGNQVF